MTCQLRPVTAAPLAVQLAGKAGHGGTGSPHDVGRLCSADEDSRRGSGLHDARAFVDRRIGLHFQWQDWSNMYVSV